LQLKLGAVYRLQETSNLCPPQLFPRDISHRLLILSLAIDYLPRVPVYPLKPRTRYYPIRNYPLKLMFPTIHVYPYLTTIQNILL
jgi:hypothetical protein